MRRDDPLDFSPAKWIWLPVERTLPGTFALFRREFDLTEIPAEAQGLVLADSRYLLTVNGQRVSWGPAPHDPRHPEADGVDLRPFLRKGRNVVGVTVLHYGHGDGTWPTGKPGLLFRLIVGDLDLSSSREWSVHLDRARRPGRAKRWYLRALQEEFDSRLHPHGWDRPFDELRNRELRGEWTPARELDLSPARPAVAGPQSAYAEDLLMPGATPAEIRLRSIPPMREEIVAASALIDRGTVVWRRDPEDWFDYRLEGAFEIATRDDRRAAAGEVRIEEAGGVFLTYELPHGCVGWPRVTLDAPKGTVMELVTQESRDPDEPWLDTHFYTWSRFVSRGVEETFEPFDFEGFRYLQIHLRDAAPGVRIRNVGVRRREVAYPGAPHLATDDAEVQAVFDAGVRTLLNSAQDGVVDGMGRERQPYSGDCGHQLHAVRTVLGGGEVSRRFLTQYAHGQLQSGVWLDSWPAYDRLARLSQRELGLTRWGPLVDHSIGFVLDHYHHWMQTGDLAPVRAHWEGFRRLWDYLRAKADGGLFPVEGLGVEAVWIDHDAFAAQGEKLAATNLYLAHMLGAAARMAEEVTPGESVELSLWRETLLAKIEARFVRDGLVVVNPGEPEPRYDDRSTSHRLLDLEPGDPRAEASLRLLVERPPGLGLSYPANSVWRFWALARHRRMDVVLKELRERWAPMRSVRENGTIGEMWEVRPGGTGQMSHCAVGPLVLAHQGLLGLSPVEPGYARYRLDPQLAGLGRFETTVHLPSGALRVLAERDADGVIMELLTPRYGVGEFAIAGELHPLLPGRLQRVQLTREASG